MFLDVEWLYRLSGYVSNRRNFKASLVSALEKLKDEQTPACCRLSAYHFSDDNQKIMVVRSTWNKTKIIK